MFGFHRIAILIVVVAGGATAVSIVDRNRRPIDRVEQVVKPATLPPQSPEVRHAEMNRRAREPADPKAARFGLSYENVVKGREPDGKPVQPMPAIAMPPTACRSVEPVPKDVDSHGPQRIHRHTELTFIAESGFGWVRMLMKVPAPIDRVELVSLLTEYEPSVYVLNEMATPARARLAERRPLDEFEHHGLEAVRRGENVVWSPEAPKRMFGAIRADKSCLECHSTAKEGDLLGAFTYYLNTRVDELSSRKNGE